MKKKDLKSILRLLSITILGLPAIFIVATYSGLRATHKILFAFVCIGVYYGIIAYFKKVNPLDRAYYDPRARQIRGESYVQIKQAYEKKYKLTAPTPYGVGIPAALLVKHLRKKEKLSGNLYPVPLPRTAYILVAWN